MLNIVNIDSYKYSDEAKSKLISIGNYQEVNIQKKEAEKIKDDWFLYFIKFEPATYISKLKIPVLAINGSLDFQVDAKSNLNGFEKNLIKAGNKNFKIIEMNGMNHFFQECTTGFISEYGEIEQTIAPTALNEMSNWILKL